MYSIDGDFGQVRATRFPLDGLNDSVAAVPFHFQNAGWHRCNERYRIYRDYCRSGHILLFSISDGGVLELNGQPPVQLPASSVAWVPLRYKHAYYTGPGKLWEFYWLEVEENPNLRFDQIFGKEPVLSVANMNAISRQIESILRSKSLISLALQVESSRVIGNIYHLLLQERLLQSKNRNADEVICEIIRTMESHCEREYNLEDLSKQHFLSIPQLIRRFKAETGMTPHAYLLMLRLQTAQMYLKHTNWSVAEVSHKTGFTSTSNFIQQFRKVYGMTPAKYRGSR